MSSFEGGELVRVPAEGFPPLRIPGGLTRLERLIYLSALQRLTGGERLSETLRELKDIAQADPRVRPTVEIHLGMLNAGAASWRGTPCRAWLRNFCPNFCPPEVI